MQFSNCIGIDLRSNPDKKVIAGDTGSPIKGERIDVFMENEQDALNWGRKTVIIKILD